LRILFSELIKFLVRKKL